MAHLDIKQLYGENGAAGAVPVAGNVVKWSNQSTGAIILPAGTTAQRPENPIVGMTRLNTELNSEEFYDGEKWVTGGGGTASDLTVGTPDDGSWIDSRYSGGKPPALAITPETRVSTALDGINEILGLLMPDAPPNFSTGTLTIPGTSAKVATGAAAPSGATLTPGATVNAVNASVTSSVISGKGSGMEGALSLFVNSAAVPGENITFTSDLGNAKATGALRVSNNVWYNTPGFFQVFDAQVNGLTLAEGHNTIQLRHSLSGNSTVAEVVKESPAAPVVSGLSVAVSGSASLLYQSGIPHYTTGTTFTVAATLSNLAYQTYKAAGNVSVAGPFSTTPALFNPGQGGLPAIFDANSAPVAFSGAVTIGGNFASTTQKIQVRGANTFLTGALADGPEMAVLAGSSGLREMIIPVSVTGATASFAVRRNTGAGNTPAEADSVWDSTAQKAAYEAAIHAGVLRQLAADLSSALPPGPNYSTHDSVQYATFVFYAPARSQFTINVTGSYAGCWVKLPGLSAAAMPNAPNGWWDAMKAYIGSGVPGRSGDTNAGCAKTVVMGGGSGAFAITFGSESSTNSTGNAILIRFRLNAGQSITALSFSN